MSPSTEIEQQRRLDRRRVHSLSVAVFAGAVIMVFGVTALLRPDHQGWLGLAVGFAWAAALAAFFIRDSDAAGTMRQPAHLDVEAVAG